jgi:gamma-glutamylputrescine oxidase
MKSLWPPQDEVFWYLKRDAIKPRMQNMEVDVAIIGGGMAGLSAAQAFHKRGKKVALFEQYYCGAGASGKSSGFITPNAELSLTDFIARYGAHTAKSIWDLFTRGVEDIRGAINEHQIECDYAAQDTLMLANDKKAFEKLKKEYENLSTMGFKTSFCGGTDLQKKIGTSAYLAAVCYEDTFGISAYLYCQQMMQVLQNSGVHIFEETPVTAINDHILKTAHADIRAEYIVVCADRFIPDLGLLKHEIYHIQTFLMISQLLADQEIRAIFPEKNYMVWDSEMIYTYFRVTGQNRLLLGGGSLLSGYAAHAQHENKNMLKKLTSYFKKRFPTLDVQFEHMWPGLIGLSKDIAPIAGRDKDKSHIYYVAACAGLPIAAALGRYSAEHLVDGRTDLDHCFTPYRPFPIGGAVQTILGNKISFAASNLIKAFGW